jgi:hypothetical protein
MDLKFNLNQLPSISANTPRPVVTIAGADLAELEAEWYFDRDTFIYVSNPVLGTPPVIPIDTTRFPILDPGVTVYIVMSNGFTVANDIYINGERSYDRPPVSKIPYVYLLTIQKFSNSITILTMPGGESLFNKVSLSSLTPANTGEID